MTKLKSLKEFKQEFSSLSNGDMLSIKGGLPYDSPESTQSRYNSTTTPSGPDNSRSTRSDFSNGTTTPWGDYLPCGACSLTNP